MSESDLNDLLKVGGMEKGLCIDGPAKGQVHFRDGDYLNLDLNPPMTRAYDGTEPFDKNATFKITPYKKGWWNKNGNVFYVWEHI